MFFKKKPKPQAHSTINNMPPDAFIANSIATALWRSVGPDYRNSQLSATLTFDTEQRLTGIKGLLVNNNPVLPSPDAMEAINQISTKMLSLDKKYHLKGLAITIANGRVETKPEFLN